MNRIPYIIDEEAGGKPLVALKPDKTTYNESWLQRLLRKHPDILPLYEIEPVFFPLIPIGREVSTSAGSIDNLFISPQGYPVLVETKLWRNPEARRDVLAQSIDYAAALSNWNYSKLAELVQGYTAEYEGGARGFVEWIEAYTREPLDVEPYYFEETVDNNLRLGRTLVVIVGDRIRRSLADMLAYLNQFPHMAMNVALIELQCFKLYGEAEWPLLVVPSILAKTEIVKRSIIQVEISKDGAPKVAVKHDDLGETAQPPSRETLTEQEYWNLLEDRAPEALPIAKEIFDYYRKREEVLLYTRANSMTARLRLPEIGGKVSLFFIRTDGVIECWRKSIQEQLVRYGLDLGLLEAYERDLEPLLRSHTQMLSMYYPLQKVDVEALLLAVDRFIKSILEAEPIE